MNEWRLFMKRRRSIKWAGLLGLVVIFIVSFSACASSGISQEDYDAALANLDAKADEISALQFELSAAKAKGDMATDLEAQLAVLEEEFSTLEANAYVIAYPDAPPRPPREPDPPGYTPPPPPTPPLPKSVQIAFHVDTVTAGAGESAYNVDANYSCMKTSIFKRGQHLIWRMMLIDATAGIELQGDDMETVVIKLPNGEEISMRYARHGGAGGPWFFTGAWSIPVDYPLGTLDYSIEVTTVDGKTGTFTEMKLPDSAVEGSRAANPDVPTVLTSGGVEIID
jgi:hypothetical protein